MGNLRHLGLSLYWFGQFFLWQPVSTVLVQQQVSELVPRSQQGTALGAVLGVGGFMAMAVPPLVGAYSDRLTTRWGRRRPIIVVGTTGAAIGLLVMMTAGSFTQLVLGYAILQVLFNGAGAAYAGLIPDVVPDAEVGRASGFLATMVQLGSGFGLVATTVMASLHRPRLTYLVIAVVILASLVPTALVARGEGTVPLPRRPRVPFPIALRAFFAPLAGGDFGWVCGTRLLVTAGITTVAYFLFDFFRDVVQVQDPGTFTSEWFLVVLVTAVPFGLAAGAISDRVGRRSFVYASGAIQSLVAIFFIAFYPRNVAVVLGVAAAYGIGYGCYYAVDWALAVDTLPDRSAAAKDMGLFHVSLTLPQVMVPALAGIALDALNNRSPNSGYRVVFSAAVVFLIAGTVLVSRIRSTRVRGPSRAGNQK